MRQRQKPRIAFLYTHPIQYFAPLARALEGRSDVDHVCYFCDAPSVDRGFSDFGVPEEWGVSLTSGFTSKMLRNIGTRQGYGKALSYVNPGIALALVRERFDALVMHGYKSITHLIALATAKAVGTKVFVRCDSQGDTQASVGRRKLLSLFDGALCVGTRNREFYQAHGISNEKLHFAPYSVDNEFFRRRCALERPRRSQIRARWRINPEACCFLFVGRLAEEKGLPLLFDAFEKVRGKRPAHLLIAGDGAMRSELERRIAAAKLSAHISLLGFLDQEAIAEAYIAADALVLPSTRDAWGLVVNEAMNFSLPILVSDRVGCAVDLVTASNGRCLPAYDPEPWSMAMLDYAADATMRVSHGAASRQIISNWGVDATVSGIIKAVLSKKT